MKKGLENQIAGLAKLKKIKLKDLPPSNVSEKKEDPPKQGTHRMQFYMHLIKELPQK